MNERYISRLPGLHIPKFVQTGEGIVAKYSNMSFYRTGVGNLQGKQDIGGWSGSFNCEEIVVGGSEVMQIVEDGAVAPGEISIFQNDGQVDTDSHDEQSAHMEEILINPAKEFVFHFSDLERELELGGSLFIVNCCCSFVDGLTVAPGALGVILELCPEKMLNVVLGSLHHFVAVHPVHAIVLFTQIVVSLLSPL